MIKKTISFLAFLLILSSGLALEITTDKNVYLQGETIHVKIIPDGTDSLTQWSISINGEVSGSKYSETKKTVSSNYDFSIPVWATSKNFEKFNITAISDTGKVVILDPYVVGFNNRANWSISFNWSGVAGGEKPVNMPVNLTINGSIAIGLNNTCGNVQLVANETVNISWVFLGNGTIGNTFYCEFQAPYSNNATSFTNETYFNLYWNSSIAFTQNNVSQIFYFVNRTGFGQFYYEFENDSSEHNWNGSNAGVWTNPQPYSTSVRRFGTHAVIWSASAGAKIVPAQSHDGKYNISILFYMKNSSTMTTGGDWAYLISKTGLIMFIGNGIWKVDNGAGTMLAGLGTIRANDWNQYLYSCKNGNSTFFINGITVNTSGNDCSPTVSAWSVGEYSAVATLNASLDMFRVYTGVTLNETSQEALYERYGYIITGSTSSQSNNTVPIAPPSGNLTIKVCLDNSTLQRNTTVLKYSNGSLLNIDTDSENINCPDGCFNNECAPSKQGQYGYIIIIIIGIIIGTYIYKRIRL